MMKNRLKTLVIVLAIPVIVYVVNIFSGGVLGQFGIAPQNISTLPFIYTSPWIHGSLPHLFGNLFGLAIFSSLCLLHGKRFYFVGSFFIITLTGIAVWFFGRANAYHIGASGWIFGLWSLVICLAWFRRSFVNIVIAILVVIFYGGMIWGVLPRNAFISYESHLFGAISGLITAYLLTRVFKTRTL